MARLVPADEEKPAKLKPVLTLRERMARAAMSALPGGPAAALMSAAQQVGGDAQSLYNRGVYDAGGAVTDFSSRLGASPQLAAGLGYTTNVGLQSLPIILSGQIAKSFGPNMQDAGRSLMTSALKPTIQQHRTGQAAEAAETMLKGGYNATESGVQKMQADADRLAKEVSARISGSSAKIPVSEVTKPVSGLKDMLRMQVNPQADLQAADDVVAGFRNHPLLNYNAGAPGKASEMSVQMAQKMKQGTYRQLADKYGEMGAAATETQKALARGLKEAISKAVPDVAKLNAQESELLNALSVAERRTLMDLNKNILGIGAIAPTPSGFAAFLMDKSAAFKSLLARMLYTGAERIPQAAAISAMTASRYLSERPEVKKPHR